ncbi:MAG: helix-turn-helix domain-containing protein [Proteobacteria bacterium]|nr:helix-turn-helix domain-containing protein [Pseudomonadota bacterium]
MLPEPERFPTFASAMVNFELSPEGDRPFAAQASAWKVGAVVIASLHATPLTYLRSEARLAADQVDHLYVNLHLDGGLVADFGGGPVRCGTGTMIAIDMRRPCRLHVGDMRSLSVAIPRQILLPRLAGRNPHGLVSHGGLIPVVAKTLRAILDSLPDLEARHVPALERVVVELVGDALLDGLPTADAARAQDEALASRARALMESRLAEPLDAARLCAELGVSRSSLYRALEGRGGVRRYLLQLRLRRVRAHLETPGDNLSLADLAERTGFADKAHLAKAFKREFGLTPGSARAAAARATPIVPALDHAAARAFGDWVSDLD